MSDLIIYTQRVEVVESYGERRDCADQRIPQYIKSLGDIPVPVPNNVEIVEMIVEEFKPKGIILTGGNSLEAYGGNAPERDNVDKRLIELSIEKKIPLFGFCRGMQSILDFFGAKLENVEGHIAARHMIWGKINEEVNSYHSQACVKENIPNELEIMAMADDNVVEAVRHKEYPILGIMWHPEREVVLNENDKDRIKRLFD